MTLGPKTTTGDCGYKAFAPSRSIRRLVALASAALLVASAHPQSTSTYKITTTLPATVAAGAAGVSLALSGTLPDFSQNTYKVCFYTGSGSAAPLTPSVTAGVPTVTVPATTIQAIPPGNFTSANGYTVPALVSIVPTGTICDGTYNASLTNSLSVPIVEPVLTAFVGPSVVPQTNSTTNIQAPPTTILLSGGNFAANTAVTFQSFPGAITRVLTPTSLSVTVPAAFSASSSDTTSVLTVCNSGAGSTAFCSNSPNPLTVSLSPLYPSTGFLSVTPSPATTADQTTLSAQFSKGEPANPLPEPGAPSGTVTFTAGSTSIPAAPLILDPNATFVQQTSTITTPVTATPVIAPAAGSYLNSTTVSIADATSGAAIYYTQDGSTPTAASTPYTGPFQITASQTIQAIAASTGALNSAVATAAYTITITPPAKLAFVVQPSNAFINTAIAPPIQVAIQDASGNTVTSSTLPVSIALARNPAYSTLSGTTTVNAVNGIATFSDLTLNNVATGNTFLAYSGNLTSTNSSTFNITPYPITMTVQSALIGINSTLNGAVTLGHAAPQGGVAVTLASDTPANVTISPSTLNIASGQTTGSFTYTGVASGNATLSAGATNYATATVAVTATAAQVSLGTIPAVAPGQSVSLALSLPAVAPPGGTTVTFTSSNTNVATVTSSIFVPAGQRTAATNPQITGIIIGSTNIIASAPGFAPDSRAVNVTVVATISPSTTYVNLGTYTTTTLNISAPAQTGGLTFTLASDAPGTATVGSSVTVPAGATSVPITLTGIRNGTTTIRADSPGVTEATGSVNVTSSLVFNTNPTTGVNLETTIYPQLPVAPPSPVTVTVTSNGPAIATISKSGTVVGGTTLTFTNITSSGQLPAIYVQGQTTGTTTLTVSAPGYTNGTATVTVDPSGFGFIYTGNFSTTTFSQPNNVTVTPIVLNPGSLTLYTYGYQVNPGLPPVNVSVISGTSSVGTITTSPVVFNGGDSGQTTTFQPAAAGTSNLTLSTPAGFSTPSQTQYAQITATVTAPAATFNNTNLITGVNLETPIYASLPVAPPNPVTVTVTSNGPAIATISKSGTVVGGTTLTFTNVTSSGSIPAIYVQGQTTGTTTLTVSAPGYTNGTATINVYPSGFGFIYTGNFSTTTFSQPNNVTVTPIVLNPGSLTLYTYGYQINPGLAPVNVSVISGTTSVGTIATSPVVFNGGDTGQTTTFQPVAAGTSNLTLSTPAGFSTPSQTQYAQITATVTAPAAAFNNTNLITGVNLETPIYASLPVAPPNPVTVTVTSNGPAISTISKSGTVVGGTTLTFTNISSSGNLPVIYVQGQTAGTTTLTVSAPGYTNGTSTINVYPSGFGFIYTGNFSTTTFSQPNNVTVTPVLLNPGSLTLYTYGYQLNPGLGGVNVAVVSSTTSVGTISTSPVVFNAGDSGQTTTFQPVAAGTSNLTLSTPSGFSTPSQSQYTQITATVTAPALTFNTNPITGLNLETPIYASLPVAPPNPVTVTVTSNGPAIATISKSGTVVGGTTLTFTNVTSSGNLPAIYVQGQSTGTTTITVSAPGYTNGTAAVTVYPSGFGFVYSGNFTTTTFSPASNISITPLVLNPGSLTLYTYGYQVNPGIGAVGVPVSSGTTSVGTITTSPVLFNGGDTGETTAFQPAAAGTSALTIGTPSGFSTPSQSQYTQITATVTAPAATFNNTTPTTGQNLEIVNYAGLAVAPPSPVTVTVTSSDPAIATLSTSATVAGTQSLTFTNVSSTSSMVIYIQGQAQGTATLTVSAPGYTSGTATVAVKPSGFAFAYTTSVATTATSSATPLTVYPFILNSGSLTVQTSAQVNPGQTVSVPVTSSNLATGVITTSPLLFSPGDSSKSTTFQPLTTGSTTLTVQPPTGFSTPSQYQQITATVQ